jgi:DNA-binding NarL/FixJ family response regulator
MLAGKHPAALVRAWSELEQGGFTVVAQVADADAAIKAATELRPQLCLLDSELPGGGILAANQISSELPETRIAVLFVTPKDNGRHGASLAGDDGSLPAATSPDRHAAALNGPIQGNGQARLPGAVFENQPPPPRSRVRYLPRLLRHYRRRRRSGMGVGTAWVSARARMGDYS